MTQTAELANENIQTVSYTFNKLSRDMDKKKKKKRTQTELLEIKTTAPEMKKTLDGINNRLHTTKKKRLANLRTSQ